MTEPDREERLRPRAVVLAALALVAVPTVHAAAPIGVSCLLSPSYAAAVVDKWIAENAVAEPEPAPKVSPSFPPWMDVKVLDEPAMGVENVTTEELARHLVTLYGCDGDTR
ncbi:hypothetical protein [Nonomuraea sp. NPDC050643]|uniref:hypothetical protein n=1 Tax=Nonomuraea sp. NPDC050643 TaxID=3155660 RepID=UPI00340B1A0D